MGISVCFTSSSHSLSGTLSSSHAGDKHGYLCVLHVLLPLSLWHLVVFPCWRQAWVSLCASRPPPTLSLAPCRLPMLATSMGISVCFTSSSHSLSGTLSSSHAGDV